LWVLYVLHRVNSGRMTEPHCPARVSLVGWYQGCAFCELARSLHTVRREHQRVGTLVRRHPLHVVIRDFVAFRRACLVLCHHATEVVVHSWVVAESDACTVLFGLAIPGQAQLVAVR
jgi:hypothetical protein